MSRQFPEWADAKDALRRRLSALRIRYTAREFDDAYSVVGSNLPIVQPTAPIVAVTPLSERRISREEAAIFCAEIEQRTGRRLPLKGMAK